jgi:polar amino acid transport system substrate-binding protein
MFLKILAMLMLELNEPGILSVATELTAAPYSFMRNGPDGYEVRMMKEVANRLGLEFQAVKTVWTDILPGVEGGTVFDLSSAVMDITPERKAAVEMIPWLDSYPAVLMRTDLGRYPVTCGVLNASTYEGTATRLGLTITQHYTSELDAILALENGLIDAVVTDHIIGHYFVTRPGSPLKILMVEREPTTKGWAVNKTKKELIRAVYSALTQMKLDGTYQTILKSL